MPWLIDPATGAPLFAPPVDGGDVPIGGTSGQVLTKQSDADEDVDWETPSGSDANYVYDFINQSTLNFLHNLGKKPAVTIIDSAGDEIEGEVIHDSVNEMTINFSAGFTGSVILN